MTSLNSAQQQALEALKKQQDAYLASVRSWKQASDAQPEPAFGEMPDFSAFGFDPENVPTLAETMESNQAFMTRVWEEQQRFFNSLNDILGRQ